MKFFSSCVRTAASILVLVGTSVSAAPPPWMATGAPPPFAAQQATAPDQAADSTSWNGYQYRPLRRRPGLPPNASGDPGTTTYSYSVRTPNGGYSYGYRIQRRSASPYSRQPASAATTPPRVEVLVSERRPVVQQNLVYRIRIHSEGNLAEAAPQPPKGEHFVLRQLGKPNSWNDGEGRLITEYTYLLIPLRAGTLELPPPRVEGRYLGGRAFDIRADHGIALYVQPPQEGVVPWLPLYDLHVEAHFSGLEQARVGEPIDLEIVLTAVGAVGGQLPTVAGQLESDDFYIYPGEVTEEGRVSADGLDLLGTRIERFTLVPRHGGRLTLPAITLPWWDLRNGRPATAGLPLRRIEVAGPVGEALRAHRGTTGLTEGRSVYFWIPLALVAVLVLTGWMLALFGRTHARRPDALTPPARLLTLLSARFQRFSPRRRLHRLRSAVARRLPVSWKLWYCLRALDREPDPEAWAQALQLLAAKHLGARPNAPLETLADVITACHPAADAVRVRHLLEELEAHGYGSRPIADFEAWKASLRAEIRPRLWQLRLKKCDGKRRAPSGLPRLNPTP